MMASVLGYAEVQIDQRVSALHFSQEAPNSVVSNSDASFIDRQ